MEELNLLIPRARCDSPLFTKRCVRNIRQHHVGEHNLYNQVAFVAALDANGCTADDLKKDFRHFEESNVDKNSWVALATYL